MREPLVEINNQWLFYILGIQDDKDIVAYDAFRLDIELSSSPKPPQSKTRITIKSKADMYCRLK